MTTPITIRYDSHEAAQRVTVTGWRSRAGLFFGDDEGAARYAGCTHRPCRDCGDLTLKHRLYCDACCTKLEIARYEALPKQPWDGTTPLCLFGGDEYFFDADAVTDYCHEHDIAPEDLRLVLCEPNYPREIVPEDICSDDCDDIPGYILEAIDAFNVAICARREPLSWSSGKVAAIIDTKDDA
jgi:hypothetical protein